MSLGAREKQALDSIEDALAGSDPRLTSLLATFTRLTSGEEMPVREKIQLGGRRPGRRLRQRLGWQRARLLLWLLISVALIATALAVSRGGGGKSTCTVMWVAGCAGQAPAHSGHPASR